MGGREAWLSYRITSTHGLIGGEEEQAIAYHHRRADRRQGRGREDETTDDDVMSVIPVGVLVTVRILLTRCKL